MHSKCPAHKQKRTRTATQTHTHTTNPQKKRTLHVCTQYATTKAQQEHNIHNVCAQCGATNAQHGRTKYTVVAYNMHSICTTNIQQTYNTRTTDAQRTLAIGKTNLQIPNTCATKKRNNCTANKQIAQDMRNVRNTCAAYASNMRSEQKLHRSCTQDAQIHDTWTMRDNFPRAKYAKR